MTRLQHEIQFLQSLRDKEKLWLTPEELLTPSIDLDALLVACAYCELIAPAKIINMPTEILTVMNSHNRVMGGIEQLKNTCLGTYLSPFTYSKRCLVCDER